MIGDGERGAFASSLGLIRKTGGAPEMIPAIPPRQKLSIALLIVLSVALVFTLTSLHRAYERAMEIAVEARQYSVTITEALQPDLLRETPDKRIVRIVSALEALRELKWRLTRPDERAPAITWGLDPRQVLSERAKVTYSKILEIFLAPDLADVLEATLAAPPESRALGYAQLKAALMLAGDAPSVTPRLIASAYWQSVRAPGQDWSFPPGLADHVDALIAADRQIAPSPEVVAAARKRVADWPSSERIHAAIIGGPDAADVRPFRLTDAGGPATVRTLYRPSGAPLWEGVPGIFTFVGYASVYLPALADIDWHIAQEAWVIDASEPDDGSSYILHDLLAFYADDMVNHWNTVLADISITPPKSREEAVDIARVLGSPIFPGINILAAAAQETRLDRDPQLEWNDCLDCTSIALPEEWVREVSDRREAVRSRVFHDIIVYVMMTEGHGLDGREDWTIRNRPLPLPEGLVIDQFAWVRAQLGATDVAPPPAEVFKEIIRTLAAVLSGPGPVVRKLERLSLRARALPDGPLRSWAKQAIDGAIMTF